MGGVVAGEGEGFAENSTDAVESVRGHPSRRGGPGQDGGTPLPPPSVAIPSAAPRRKFQALQHQATEADPPRAPCSSLNPKP